ncbi:hypothetical protein [Streptomyces sp. FIT100]|uniref:hypothetical protein n=1 Tax=Streptomyces sp. FIT100 TaxID=2837956 RepID=UPI0021C576E5|nr:hypothetical protein [Streptomyces sp. FIT100]UUN27287.1 hypothetical protein KK483_13415 [Streptomyces sp. FIT100]
MSAMSLALLLTAAAATAVGAAALHAAHGLRKQVTALRSELAAAHTAGTGPFTAAVPQARTAPAEEIRAAVAEALAEERERELAEARAFWAAQEARDAADAPSLLGGSGGLGDDLPPLFIPRQADFAGLEALEALDAMDLEAAEALDELDSLAEISEPSTEFAEDSPELAAARRRHPSHPDFVPVQTPVVTDHERTVARLEELAETGTALTDVRPGPLGTLDVYVFADGTTLCMTPGHRETAERLAEALRNGETPVLLGGSGVSGAYALTFSCGSGENVYILADRVIASL